MKVSKLMEIIRVKTADQLPEDGNDEGCLATNETLLYYINNALDELALRGKLLIRTNTDTIDLKATISEYEIPNGSFLVNQILDKNNNKITKIQEVDLDGSILIKQDWRNNTDTIPIAFIQTPNNTVRFYPIPSIDSTVTVKSFYFHDEVKENNELPEELINIHQRGLIHWVLYEYYDTQDADAQDAKASEHNLDKFTEMFGERLPALQFTEMLSFPEDAGSHRDY